MCENEAEGQAFLVRVNTRRLRVVALALAAIFAVMAGISTLILLYVPRATAAARADRSAIASPAGALVVAASMAVVCLTGWARLALGGHISIALDERGVRKTKHARDGRPVRALRGVAWADVKRVTVFSDSLMGICVQPEPFQGIPISVPIDRDDADHLAALEFVEQMAARHGVQVIKRHLDAPSLWGVLALALVGTASYAVYSYAPLGWLYLAAAACSVTHLAVTALVWRSSGPERALHTALWGWIIVWFASTYLAMLD